MRIPAILNHGGTNPAAVVTNQYTQEGAQVLNFNLDLCCFGMAQRVDDRFPADQKELLLD